MGFRFRRSIKILPGIRINLGKRGVSLSAGVRGAHITIGKSGTRTTVGIPGTGVSYTDYERHQAAHPAHPAQPGAAAEPEEREIGTLSAEFVVAALAVLVGAALLFGN